jgi:putative cardiolipin synthase
MIRTMGVAARKLDIVSAYFVPTRSGVDAFSELAARGVRVRVLTNSLAATDVAIVHAGYSRYRKQLLRAGIQLFELKPSARIFEPPRHWGSLGSSSTSLHAKTFSIDRLRVYVGSFNFDPRSAGLNTEMGLAFAGPLAARQIADALDHDIEYAAYEVRAVGGEDTLEWIERTRDGERRHRSEPESSVLRRFAVRFFELFPVEPLL